MSIVFAILQTHRTKLEDMEFSVAQADAFLPEQGRAGAVVFYDQGVHRQKGEEQRHDRQGVGQVERTCARALVSRQSTAAQEQAGLPIPVTADRKSKRLNSSH